MQKKLKLVPFNFKQIQPIKIRDVRVSTRKNKRTVESNDRNLSNENRSSTAASQKSLSSTGRSIGSARFDSSINSIHSIGFIQEGFNEIQKINEKPEYEEDSVILELNDLLSIDKNEKHEGFLTERVSKPPSGKFQSKITEKIIPLKSVRKVHRNFSHRIL